MAAQERSHREGDQLRHELLAAASALAVSPRPVVIPSLRAVARACGVSPTAVYRHFASQSAMAAAVLGAESEAFERVVLAADDPGQEPVERLRSIAQAYAAWGAGNPGVYQLLFESADQLEREWASLEPSTQLVARITDLLEAHAVGRGLPPAAPGEVAEHLWASLHGLVSLRIHKPAHPWVTDLADSVDGVVRGLGL